MRKVTVGRIISHTSQVLVPKFKKPSLCICACGAGSVSKDWSSRQLSTAGSTPAATGQGRTAAETAVKKRWFQFVGLFLKETDIYLNVSFIKLTSSLSSYQDENQPIGGHIIY